MFDISKPLLDPEALTIHASQYSPTNLKPLPDDELMDKTKLKAFADDKS